MSISQKHFGLRCRLFRLGSIVSHAGTGKSTERRSRCHTAQDASLDAVERQRVISGAIANLKQHYFDRDVAQKMADALLAHEKSGDDNAAADGEAFASLLTSQMRTASHDMHLVVEYSQRPLPLGPPVQTAESLARFRNAMLQQNCMIRKVEILPHDIGYLKLDFFPDSQCVGSGAESRNGLVEPRGRGHL